VFVRVDWWGGVGDLMMWWGGLVVRCVSVVCGVLFFVGVVCKDGCCGSVVCVIILCWGVVLSHVT
jgi:hypothetical protein